jgi:uncharacterized paraquat-inducible protein A
LAGAILVGVIIRVLLLNLTENSGLFVFAYVVITGLLQVLAFFLHQLLVLLLDRNASSKTFESFCLERA